MLGFFGGYLLKDKLHKSSKDSIENKSSFTYESKRAPYSFKYPSDFKIGIQSDSHVYQFEERIDAVNLGTEENTPNGNDGTAYLIVDRYPLDGPSIEETVQTDYELALASLDYYDDDKKKLQPPQIIPIKIGNVDGFKVIQQPVGTFASGNTKYYVDRSGIRYTIGTLTTNEEKLIELESILETFNFSY